MRELIIDGYNVLHTVPRYARLLERDHVSARARLIDDAASFAAGRFRATVVFDGGGRSGTEAEADVAGVRVLFSSEGQDADSVIEALARAVRDRGGRAVVVTSDATTQWTVMGAGVVRMSAREFADEMTEDATERDEHARSGSSSGTIDTRIDPETHSALIRMRDRRG